MVMVQVRYRKMVEGQQCARRLRDTVRGGKRGSGARRGRKCVVCGFSSPMRVLSRM